MIPNPLANRLAWRRVVTTSPLLRGCTSSPHRPLYLAGHFWLGAGIVFGVALLVLAITALAPVPVAHAQPDDGERALPGCSSRRWRRSPPVSASSPGR